MKRTPLRLKRPTPRRNEGRIQHMRTKRKRGDRTTEEVAHVARVAQLPCCVTGRAGVHVHHLLIAPGKRAGRDHRWVVPIAPELHNMGDGSIHALGSEAAFEREHGLSPGFFIETARGLWEGRGE